MLDILVIAPHPDDAELGMGGAILKFRSEGLAVGVLDLTDGEPTPHGSPEIRRQETAAATAGPGALLAREPGPAQPQPGSDASGPAAVGRGLPPDPAAMDLAPYWIDAHPDHTAATQLVEAARFWSKLTKTDMPGEPYYPPRLFYYYCFHLRMIPQPAFVLDISDFWDRKRAAMECYRSQFHEGRPQGPDGFVEQIREQAAAWGWSIGVRYGEPFATREPVGLGTMKGVV